MAMLDMDNISTSDTGCHEVKNAWSRFWIANHQAKQTKLYCSLALCAILSFYYFHCV